jgi:redox-sensitive bicupin YhaK (pirin superfamily)
MTSSLRQTSDLFKGHSGLLFRPAEERFHSRHGWLDSWHSFSFAGHDDPRWRGFGPLLVINDDTIAASSGFGLHPHRHMEIITVMVDGVLTHRDSMGNAEELRAGDVQRMSAGTGILHSEMNESLEPCRLLQIWIAPDSQRLSPSYGQKHFAIGNDWTPLIAPDQVDGAMAIQRSVRLWRARPTAGQALSLPLAAGAHGWIQMIEGEVEVGLGDPDDDTVSGARGLGGVPDRAEGTHGVMDGGGSALVGRGGIRGGNLAESRSGGQLRRGDGLGFAGRAITSLTGGSNGADLLLFNLG